MRLILNRWGCTNVELRESDIVKLDPEQLPEKIAVALIDVDIAEPTKVAIEKIMPRLSPGGVILVDDCAEDNGFKGARKAVLDMFPQAQFKYGMAIIPAA